MWRQIFVYFRLCQIQTKGNKTLLFFSSDVHQSQFDSLMHDNSKKIEFLKQKHSDEVKQLELKHVGSIEKEKLKYADELSIVKSNYESKIEISEAKHNDEVQTLKLKNTELQTKLSDLVDNMHDSSSSQYVKVRSWNIFFNFFV